MSQCFVKGQTLLYDICLHDMVLIWVAAEHVYYNNKTGSWCVAYIVVMAPVCTSALNEVMLLCLFLLYLCLFTTEQTIKVKAYFPFSWNIKLYSECQTYFLAHLSEEQSACKVSFMSRHLQVSVFFTCVLTAPLTPSSSYLRAALLHKKDTNLYLLFTEKHSFIILCCLN